MSIHKSLKLRNTLRRHRNVLTRAERIKILTDEGKATDERSVFALPKVRSILIKEKAKVKEAVAAVPGAAPVAGAAPAGAAPAAGAKGGAPAAGGKPGAPAAKAAAPKK